MTTRNVISLLPLCLLFVSGCAHKEPVPVTRDVVATVKAEQPEAAPATITSSGKVINAVAAVVNDEIITLYEVNREAQSAIREKEKKGALDDAERHRIRRAALDALVEKHLVEQKIRELNIKISEEEIRQSIDDVKKQNNMSQEALVSALAGQGLSFDQYRSQLTEQLEKLKLISMEVRSKILVSETEAREFYEANRIKYAEEDAFRARHIFFKATEKASSEEIKRSMTTALMVLAEAKNGKDFAELAKTYSEDPAARKDGGELGRFRKGDMQPELEQAVISLKPGDISELVYTPAGFHIIKLEERISGKMKPFESVKGEIEESLYRKKSEERFSQWAKDLRAKATIDIRDLKGLL
ncbi:peptidylprolyl isomerase [Pelotalea chapellei]|uniref:Peptidylprolyl isomerase n=1 Tax=Pelotalea chapellei TaxID=44671 RepID=A0ABS5U4Q8_9BACT|nr:peptidylprolyl isomerase [Pelotalea chapellei]MBT1070653.1 peptidylprolyl isomerase [Pelotalea chapellei]